MGTLTKKQLLGRPRVKKVPLPDMAVAGADHVYVRKLNARMTMGLADVDDKKPIDGLIAACIAGVCDKNGVALFTSADRDKLADLPFDVLNRLADAIMEFNGMTEAGSKARKKDSGNRGADSRSN